MGLKNAINHLKVQISEFDFVILSNVDLTLEKNFFNNLLKLSVEKSIGWIAPRILSEKENRDRNPKILTRPSYKKNA